MNRIPDASAHFRNILRRNSRSGVGGTYAVCSSHPRVIEAAIRQSMEDTSLLHVESTSSQVNQFGGYSGQTPAQFAQSIRSATEMAGLPRERVLMGGDHLGPFPWRSEAADVAMAKACELVRQSVRAGYQKIHLDPSMRCASDDLLSESIVAQRAAILCAAAEEAFGESLAQAQEPVYVIGTEVPAPGGELGADRDIRVTSADDVHRTLALFQREFQRCGLSAAWERVVALVVQPGVDFDANSVLDYESTNAHLLSGALASHEGLVYEAHSTDYQSPAALARMVKDHFAILKVGPWLTFAFREVILALGTIEREMLQTKRGHRVSSIREALISAMRSDPRYWQDYYHGDEEQVSRNLIYGYSDRCRYYWNDPGVLQETAQLFKNLSGRLIPLPLLSQYLPDEYQAVRIARIAAAPETIVSEHIQNVMRRYAAACAAPHDDTDNPSPNLLCSGD